MIYRLLSQLAILFSHYKEIFVKAISNANVSGARQSGLLDAQNLITEMLPEEGLIVPSAKSVDEGQEEAEKND